MIRAVLDNSGILLRRFVLSSPEVTRVFCRGCGTQLCYRNANADYVGVTLASLDDPTPFTPARTTFEEHKLSWASPI